MKGKKRQALTAIILVLFLLSGAGCVSVPAKDFALSPLIKATSIKMERPLIVALDEIKWEIEPETVVGAHYMAGSYAQGTYYWNTAKPKNDFDKKANKELMVEGRLDEVVRAELTKAGFKVAGGEDAQASSMNQLKSDCLLHGRISDFFYNTYYYDLFLPKLTESGVTMDWELKGDDGSVIYKGQTRGSAIKEERIGTEAVFEAFRAATSNLVSDPFFANAAIP